MTGQKFGRLSIIERVDSNTGRATWLCKCDCGNETVVEGKKLRNGHTKSCGCYRKEVTAPNQGRKNKHDIEYVNVKLKENGFELLSDYNGIDSKCKFKCLTCNLVFERMAWASLHNTHGCPSCSKLNNGFMQYETFNKKPHLKEIDATLYLIEFTDGIEHFWKIGITRDTIEGRIRKIPYEMVYHEKVTGKLFDIYLKEKELKRANKQYRYRPSKTFNGHTECFSKPIEI